MKKEITESIARNFSIMFGAQTITWITSFVLLMFLPRYLGSEDYGRLYLALSVKMMLGLLIDFGGNFLITKEVARSKEVGIKVLNSYLILRVLLWAIAVGTLILLSEVLGYSQHVHLLILVLVIGKLFEGGTLALKSYFEGIERTEYPSVGMIVERVFISIFSVAALLMGADSLAIAVIFAVGMLLNFIVIGWFSRKFIAIKYQFDSKTFQLLGSGLPYFLFSLFTVIYFRVDAVMLSSMTTETVTGWYGGAYRFFDTVMVFPIIYTTAIFPIFSKLWKDENGLLEDTLGKSLKFILILGVPIAMLIFLFSEPIIEFFMGLEEYGPSVLVLQIFALTIPLIYVDFILSSAIMGAANKQKAWACVGFVAIFINIGANFVLIPYTQTMLMNGGIGAALATFLTELFVMICAIYLLPSSYFKTFKMSYILKPLGAGVAMTAFVLLLDGTNIYWIILMFAGFGVYMGGIFVLKTFRKDELELIKSFASYSRLKMMISDKKINV